MNTIYLSGAFGDFKKPPFGGGEAGNRRTKRLLESLGYNVVILPKYIISKNVVKKFNSVVSSILVYIFKLLFGNRQAVVHISGFSGSTVYWNLWQIKAAKLLGYRTVYEMRGGSYDYHLEIGSKSYVKSFERLLKSADYIFSQGLENIPIIKAIKNDTHIFYYPNYVTSEFLPSQSPIKQDSKINLLFFGRLSTTKQIEIMLETVRFLKDTIAIPVELVLIGSFSNSDYKETITKAIQNLKISENVTIKGAMSQQNLKTYLQWANFFLFPSAERGEGHSNSLTEAMAFGCIPIASRQGFSESVVNNKELIIDICDPRIIADKISSIVISGRIATLSNEMYTRVKNCYLESIVAQKMKETYESIFSQHLK